MRSGYQRKVRLLSQLALNTFKSLGKPKVFCVGKNKTGTTSVKKAFYELGLIVGEQYLAERLMLDWARRDFRRLFWYCHTAQAFQDVPFSLPFTFQALDMKYPGSKFILTVRDSADQWYQSLTNFHAVLFGKGHLPTPADLQAAEYVRSGWVYQSFKLIHNTPSDDLYNREILISNYTAHNNAVIEYFRHRPQDLLALNVAQPNAYDDLCDFLGKPRTGKNFPWENKTIELG